ncbi:MAG: isopentenyl-diphosphate Delta-isomerase [Hyphomicrobium sp.]|uniref:isopentenyl-diphosphate Delta-isomerase n=1 Tax=Hyphomicrobium sp. TaxID=82 RepID=UPI00132AE390|nr:isopentenyl-diphosphate Delta-isomerase [Hyphomicrobium sp.]KAB2942026.1 MAG: isopentenyl-diphosphate Delta-isomerase [Hyphomicrobium sp.]MBZ0210544.1 isopentenyl-diphosphate Delta-isomerase [Hyphomicrobium sp.]
MNDARETVILVDAADQPVGTAPKLAAHQRGDLHRAFSVLIHDGAGQLLLQKRHAGKYHSGGLWTNACCGHPRPGEETQAAALRRLSEEMGFSCPLVPLGALIYRAEVGGGLIEHEYVHLFTGRWCGAVTPHPDEAEAHAWLTLSTVQTDIAAHPDRYTAWFRLYLTRAETELSAAMQLDMP